MLDIPEQPKEPTMPLMPYGSHKNAGLASKVSKQLMPYGSQEHASVASKIGPKQQAPIKIDVFQPYGSAENASLMVKAGAPKTPRSRPKKVVRLNAGKG